MRIYGDEGHVDTVKSVRIFYGNEISELGFGDIFPSNLVGESKLY